MYDIKLESRKLGGCPLPLSPGGEMVGLAYLDGNTMVSHMSMMLTKTLFSALNLWKWICELS
jgi:hypothetical protein